MNGQYDYHVYAYRIEVFVRSFPEPTVIEVGPGVYRVFLEELERAHAGN